MIYRKRVYQVIPDRAEIFTRFFLEYLLPNQVKHGAKCIGRWINKEKTEITVIWEYENIEHFRIIEQKVQMDPLHRIAQKKRAEIGPLFTDMNEEFVYDTLDREIWRILD